MCKGKTGSAYLEGRQGASTKRANGDFLCPAWKIVIGRFNYLYHNVGYLRQFACADYLTNSESRRK